MSNPPLPLNSGAVEFDDYYEMAAWVMDQGGTVEKTRIVLGGKQYTWWPTGTWSGTLREV